jgi:tripeptidyl-peptidase I
MTWITLKVTREEAERLLEAEYFVYEHDTGQTHVACESYSIPHRLQKHIDIVTPTVHFDAPIRPGGGALSKRDPAMSIGTEHSNSAVAGSSVKKGPILMPWEVGNNLANCSEQTVPDCLRVLYSIPEGDGAHPNNSFGIVEYTPQSYVSSDLDMFFSNYSPALVGQVPTMNSIDGGALYTLLQEADYNEESDLDLTYAMALAYPLNVTLYQVGDSVEGASFNNFLDAIDGSYCTYDGGDDPSKDPVYPDPASQRKEAYEGPANCGGFPPTNVISTSYAFDEAEVTPRYATRQCYEYMKLGLQGVTILYASGDYGMFPPTP